MLLDECTTKIRLAEVVGMVYTVHSHFYEKGENMSENTLELNCQINT